MAIRDIEDRDVEAIVALSLRAWQPVFASIAATYGARLFELWHPDGWEPVQEHAVRETVASLSTRVAVVEGEVVGFCSVRLRPDDLLGEIEMVAVDPSAQGRGVGRLLVEDAVEVIRAAGLPIAMIETGADEGHAPARRTYEDAGFERIDIARYFRVL